MREDTAVFDRAAVTVDRAAVTGSHLPAQFNACQSVGRSWLCRRGSWEFLVVLTKKEQTSIALGKVSRIRRSSVQIVDKKQLQHEK